jgi:hypothetical protein
MIEIPLPDDRPDDADLPDPPRRTETNEPAVDDEDDEIITCWCGASGTFDELFDDALFDEPCNGDGFLECYCGGDQCVCHHHGQEVECPGCEDCLHDRDEFDDDPYDPSEITGEIKEGEWLE